MQTEASTGLINAAIKYNPHLWGPEELRAIFVVRQTDLADIVAAVRDTPATQVPQHILVCGHRGMGKSTLLRRLALSINDTPELSAQWLPLVFPEEQYTVRTLAELWLNVLDALADALEQAGAAPDELALLDARVCQIADMPPVEAESAAIDLLTRWVADHQRGLVLLIDSSDLLLNSLAHGEGKAAKHAGNANALWRLRNVLSHQPGLFWIGASYQALESHHQYQDAFHDFFAQHELRPLDLAEMRSAMLALALRFGAGRGLQGEAAEKEMARILDTRPERLKTLRLLSGGNPRTMVTLYELFAAGGDDSIQADLKRLLDIMTPLYKARMEALSEQPQKIFAHIMESWSPIGVRELAAEAGIPATTISGQLARLEVEGLIEKARLPGKTKRSGYQASERFFNVWYLMRYGTRRLRQRLTWAVQFMRLWFSREELSSMAGARSGRHARGEINDLGNLEFSRAVAAALGDGDGRGLALEWNVLSAAHRESCRTRQAIRDILPESLFDLDGSDSDFKDAADYLKRFSGLDDKLAACRHASVAERGEWINEVKGSISLSLEEKERLADAMAGASSSRSQYEETRKVFAQERKSFDGEQPDKESNVEILNATLDGRFFPDCPNSKVAFSQMEACFGTNPPAYEFALDLLAKRHHDEWVGRAYRHAIQIADNPAPLWNRLGQLLQDHLECYDEAEVAYRQAIVFDANNASLWSNLGDLLLFHLDRYDEAEVALRRAIDLDKEYVDAWDDLGYLLHYHFKRYDEAEAVIRQAIALDEKSAYAWYSLGSLLHYSLKRYDEAEAAYRQAIVLDECYAYPWDNLGDLLRDQLMRYHEAEAAYRRAIALDEKDAFPWNGLGDLLHYKLKRYDEAEIAYREAIALDGTSADTWNSLGALLADNSKRYDEAEAAYRQAIALDRKDMHSWSGLGYLLHYHLKRYEEAETAYRKAIAIDEKEADFWNNLGNLQQDHLKRYDEAEAAYRQAIVLDEGNSYPLANLARLLGVSGRRDEASSLYRTALSLADGECDELLLQAHLWLGNVDSAKQALDTLTNAAAIGDAWAFFRIREQCCECEVLGLGSTLAELMNTSPWADFLQPFSLALTASAAGEPPVGAPPEILSLAEEVLDEIRNRRRQAPSTKPGVQA